MEQPSQNLHSDSQSEDNLQEQNSLDQSLSQGSKEQSSLWSELKADAIANGGEFSSQRFIKLLLLHSGFQLLVLFRLQQRLRKFGGVASFVGDILLKFATDLTGCHLYPDVHLEAGIHFPHATGIVIGKGVIIRQGARIFQNVTLGRRTRDKSDCPELRQGCIIYAGVQVLGGVIIGQNAVVGANAVVLQSVPDHAIAVGIPAKIINP